MPETTTEPLERASRPWLKLMQIAYAFLAGVFCVWLGSFTPITGSRISIFLPAQTGAVLHLSSGTELLALLSHSSVLAEAQADPELKEWAKPLDTQAQLKHLWLQAPQAVRQFIPPTLQSLEPFMGQECGVAVLTPFALLESKRQLRQDPPMLVFTRLSRAPGQLARMALRFVEIPQYPVFDLGGDLIAIGINGACPAGFGAEPLWPNGQPPASATPLEPLRLPHSRPAVLARVLFWPHQWISPQPARPLPAFFPSQDVPGSVLEAMRQPPTVLQMLNLNDNSDWIEVNGAASLGAPLVARGYYHGRLPPPPKAAALNFAPAPEAFAEGLLPVDLRACFMAYLASDLRPVPQASVLNRTQRRWLQRLEPWTEGEMDLEHDLWPACGKAIFFQLHPTPADLTASAYGVLEAALPFHATENSRLAVADLVRLRWEDLFDLPPKVSKPPYVRRFGRSDHDRYVLATGQITAPSWTVFNNRIALTSDAGPFALLDSPPPASPEAAATRPMPEGYYLRLDGPGLSGAIEAFATAYYDSLNEDLGSQKFAARYPDAPVQILRARKLSALLGLLNVKLEPSPQGTEAVLNATWTAGTLKAEPPAAVDSVK